MPSGGQGEHRCYLLPKAIARGAILKTNARVREITLGKDGLADGAVYYDSYGRVQRPAIGVVGMALIYRQGTIGPTLRQSV